MKKKQLTPEMVNEVTKNSSEEILKDQEIKRVKVKRFLEQYWTIVREHNIVFQPRLEHLEHKIEAIIMLAEVSEEEIRILQGGRTDDRPVVN